MTDRTRLKTALGAMIRDQRPAQYPGPMSYVGTSEYIAQALLTTPSGAALAALVEAAARLADQGHVITGQEARFYPDGRAGSRLLVAVSDFRAATEPATP